MYTVEMATAFKSLTPPENFGVTILDANDFLTVQIDPEDIESLLDHQVEDAIQYIKDVKRVLEERGAIVYIVREALKD
jgi:hypothetical protein